ncbi:MAG: GNAT family N-acetyltransferase [Syntrophaceae bacterium]|nr:GNAT family N-acetyltransferase [Syntrophaceae bacterium]
MNPSSIARLTVPADMRFLETIRGFVRELASAAGLSQREILGLELAAEEASVNTIEHAYPDGRPGDIFLKAEIGRTELVLSIRDEGLPFDPDLEGAGVSGTVADEFSARGLGLRIIRHEVDEARFENLGRRGKALRLVKRLTTTAEPEPEHLPPRIEPASPQPYEIRTMKPGEAIQVARIFWLAYGYSYKNENFYRPEGLLYLVGSGRLTSTVAVTENGEVVGHAGILRPTPAPMAEAALLVINPAHRGRGLMGALSRANEARALEMGLLGMSVDPVTSHAISQRDVMRLGGRPCGLDLAASPPRLFKALGSETAPPQRESCLHCFRYFDSPPPVKVHVPPRHREIVTRIYEGLAQACTFGDPAPASASGEYRIDFDKTVLKGIIRVVRADERQWPELLRAADDLAEYAGAEVVNLDLPLEQPAAALLCERAEEAGFFFSGLRPREAPDGDSLRLQRLHCPFDPDRLQFFDEFGRLLFDYVKAGMGESGKKATGSGG